MYWDIARYRKVIHEKPHAALNHGGPVRLSNPNRARAVYAAQEFDEIICYENKKSHGEKFSSCMDVTSPTHVRLA